MWASLTLRRHKTKSNCRENFSHYCVCCSLLSVLWEPPCSDCIYTRAARGHWSPPSDVRADHWVSSHHLLISEYYQFSQHFHWQLRWDNWDQIVAQVETIERPLEALMMLWLQKTFDIVTVTGNPMICCSDCNYFKRTIFLSSPDAGVATHAPGPCMSDVRVITWLSVLSVSVSCVSTVSLLQSVCQDEPVLNSLFT